LSDANAAAPLGLSGRIARTFLDTQITPLLALLGLLLGLFAVLVTPKEEEPQINVTMANVMIAFPGASSDDVHNLVTVPAEQVLSQITGIEHVFSVTRPGLTILTIQFKVGEDRIASLVRLHDTLQANADWLPQHLGVQPPIVKPRGIDDVPIVALTLHGRGEPQAASDLQRVAHALEIELKRVPGTREVTTLGGPDQVVRVTLDPERMAAQRITVADIERELRATGAAAPAGQLTSANRVIDVRAGEFFQSAADVERLVLAVRASAAGNERRPVFLADVARVAAGPDTPDRYVWHGEVAETGGERRYSETPAVTIAVSKKAGENAASVADALLARVEQLRGTVLPEDVAVSVTRNYGETARDKANSLIKKLIFATLSVVALVWVALGRREALVVGIAVVLTLALTLFASWAWGFTLNRVSLFALIFSIGILVDDAIVVVENIHRRAQFDHAPAVEMIPRAVDEVGGPTILATFTVIAALLPMAFVSGLMGPYMAPIPINSSMGMLLSLAVAFVVTPLWDEQPRYVAATLVGF
jgi:multidrug efflux pump subunit AcrB